MISNGSYGKLDDDQISRAWHIEVNTKTMRDDLPKLRNLFRAEKNDNFVEGKKLRLIPEYGAVNLKSRETVAICREKQKLFVKNIMKTTSGSLVAIDTSLTAAGTTLRDLIMAIPHPGRPDWSLFASVDRTWHDLIVPKATAGATRTYHRSFSISSISLDIISFSFHLHAVYGLYYKN